MKKILVMIFLLATVLVKAQEITPKMVIDKYINAIGGNSAISNVKDLYLEMGGEMQGQSLKMVTQKKAPNKLFLLVTIDGMGEVNKTIFDGNKGTMASMGNTTNIDEGEALAALKSQTSMFGEVEYLKDLSKLKYEGLENIDGVDCHVLIINNSVGEAKEYYEVVSGLKKRQNNTINSPMGEVNMVTDFSDYKEVSGVKFPYKIKQDMGMVAFELGVVEIKVNSDIPESVFEVK